jgi:predicted membrane protein
MQTIKFLFNALNYCFFVFYSFTLIDVAKKITFGEFYLSNATNLLQFLMTLIAVFFAYYKLRTYIRDSRIKSQILEQELREKQDNHFYKKWNKEFIEPKKDEK